MALKCIPFNPDWANETKEDFKAIYRRRKQDNWGTPILDDQGREQWDLTGPLPLRQHDAWLKKGFVYVTLYVQTDDKVAWPKIAAWIQQTLREDPWSYMQNRRDRSTFSAELYLQGQVQAQSDADKALRALVAQYGPDAVIAIKRQTDPHFQLPKELLAVSRLAEALAEADDMEQAIAANPDRAVDPPKRRGRPPKARAEVTV